MSYGSAVIPGRTGTKQKRPARKDSNSSAEERSSSSDDEPPKQPAQKQKRKAAQSTDSDDPASSGDERRKKQSAKARKTSGSSRKVPETKSRPRKSSKKREVSTEEDNSSGSSTDDRGYKNNSQGAQKKHRNKWTDANGRATMNKRERHRRPGGRVMRSGAFPGKGHSLVAVDDLSDDISTYRRRAGSRNAREARAIAAESRTSATAGRSGSRERTNKATSKKRAKPRPRESSGDEAPKRRKKADTDSEDIDEDSDRPAVKRKSVFDFSDPELRALVGADSDSQVDQLQDSSDENLPTLRHVVMPSQKMAQMQPKKPVKKDTTRKAADTGTSKDKPVASGSGRSWTASRDHRDAPVPVKQKRPEQKFFSDAKTQKRLKENLAISTSEMRAAAAKRKAANTIEIESGDESDENDGLPPRLSRSSGVPSRLKPIKVASKPKSSNTKVIDITDSEAESDSDFD